MIKPIFKVHLFSVMFWWRNPKELEQSEIFVLFALGMAPVLALTELTIPETENIWLYASVNFALSMATVGLAGALISAVLRRKISASLPHIMKFCAFCAFFVLYIGIMILLYLFEFFPSIIWHTGSSYLATNNGDPPVIYRLLFGLTFLLVPFCLVSVLSIKRQKLRHKKITARSATRFKAKLRQESFVLLGSLLYIFCVMGIIVNSVLWFRAPEWLIDTLKKALNLPLEQIL